MELVTRNRYLWLSSDIRLLCQVEWFIDCSIVCWEMWWQRFLCGQRRLTARWFHQRLPRAPNNKLPKIVASVCALRRDPGPYARRQTAAYVSGGHPRARCDITQTRGHDCPQLTNIHRQHTTRSSCLHYVGEVNYHCYNQFRFRIEIFLS